MSMQIVDAEIAREALIALVSAYDRGETHGGSVDWEDLDLAYELALAALGQPEARK